MDTQACCSHSRITRITENHPPGFTTEYWKCETCETRFCPEPLMQGRVLRDYFAAMALQGMLSSPKQFNNKVVTDENDYSKMAYITADAMIAQREKKS